jgi:hypothetical protein
MNNTLFSFGVRLRLVASCVVLGWFAQPARAGNPNLLFTRLPDSFDTQTASFYTALADLNGDGKPDLIRTIPGTGVGVQLGLGSGSFAPGTYQTAGALPGPILVADFNNDGKLDVVVANLGTADNGSLSVLLGNGNGTLQSQTVINLGFVVERFVVTDYNKDGKADIVAVGYHSGSIPLEGFSVTLPGNGDGTFGTPTFYVNSARTDYADTRDVVVGDFNGDGWPDYVVSNPVGSGIAVFFNNQNGTFTRRAREMTFGGNIASLATGDFNGDGKLDLAVILASDQTYGNTGPDDNVAIVTGNGDGTFGTFSSTAGVLDWIGDARYYRARPSGYTFVHPRSRLISQDMDGDGKLDLVFITEAGDGIYEVLSILRGVGDGTFSQGAQLTANRFSLWASVADLNQDGAVDLVVTANDSFTQTYLGIPPGSGTLLVTTASDEDDGTPNPAVGTGTSLREAWNQAMTQVTPQTITFAANLAGQTIYLTNVSDTFQGPSALRVAPSRIVSVQGLSGTGGITIDGSGIARPFFVAYDFAGGGTAGTLTLSDLTIQNGRSTYGGGIYNLGTLTMLRCTLTRNTATSQGGAIYNGGNPAAPPRALLVNCTISGNSGTIPGIFTDARLDLLHVTICSNNAGCCGAVGLTTGGILTMTNTIVAGNRPADIIVNGGTVHPDSSYNLVGSSSGGLVNDVNGNIVGIDDPGLGPLMNNGGPTLTMALQIESSARDTGLGVTAASIDQRGVSRPQNAGVDIGAFELQTIAPQITSANAATFTLGASNSFTVTASGSPVPNFTTSSTLPNGVTLSTAGVLSGTPTASGVFPLTIVAANGVGNAATQSFTLTVLEPSSLVVTTPNDTVANDGVTSLREAIAYAQSLGGTQAITFAPALAGQDILLNAGATGGNDDTALRVNFGALTIDGGAGVTLRMTATGRRHLLVGGGAALTLKNLTLTGGDLRGVNDGAAVWNAGSLTINNCRLAGNRANSGGAIWSGGTLAVVHSTFAQNQSTGYGGALSANGAAAMIVGCTFEGNSALPDGNGGGIVNFGAAMGITNCTFVGNSAVNGGAIIHYGNVLALCHNTIVSNTVVYSGGGIERVGRVGNDFLLINNLIALNSSASVGPDAYSYNDINNGTFTSLGHNLIGNGAGTLGISDGVNGDMVGSSGAPINPRIGALQTNGGPVATVALLPGSPAAGAGASIAAVSTDQRGFARPAGNGLMGRFYAVPSPSLTLLSPLSNLEAATPLTSAVSPRIDFGAGTESNPGDGSVLDRAGTTENIFGSLGVDVGIDNIAALWTGFITVPETADYRFTTRSDDGSVLYVDGQLVVNNNFFQPMNNVNGTIHLSAGLHALRIGYFEGGGDAGMQLSWEQLTGSAPFGRQIVPPGALSIGTGPDIGAFQHFVTELPTPLISPASGIYEGSVTVSLSTTTAGATIRYTTDGSAPTESHGDVYTAPFTLSASDTVRAVAILTGWLPSPVASAAYDVRSGLAAWRAVNGLADDGSQDFANPSGDGVANIAKYAFNLAPNAGALVNSNRTVLPPNGTAGIPSITVNPSQQLVIQFVRRKASANPGLAYIVETSATLSNWTALELSNAVVQSIDSTWERVTVIDTNTSSMRFGRVKLMRFDAYRNDFNAALGAVSLRGTALWTNQAVQLTDATNGQLGAVVFEGAYAGPALNGFTARFNMNLGPAGQGVPADGISFAVGDLGASAWGESGPGTARNLTISFDTYDNGGDGSIGIRVFSNNVAIASNPLNPFTGGVTVPVEITYDVSFGLTVKFNGATIFNQIPTPGFVLPIGSKFGIGGRTGGAVERAVVDDLEIIPR